MRSHFSPTTRTIRLSVIRSIAIALAIAVSGVTLQTVSALEFTTAFDIEEIGYELWRITGTINVNEEEGEIATIDFGGAIEGESTATDIDGTFDYNFSAPYGAVISFTGSTATEQTDTEIHELFDPSGEP